MKKIKNISKLILGTIVGAITSIGVIGGVAHSQLQKNISKAELKKVSSSTPLYLEHAKYYLTQDSNPNESFSHKSHSSHSSHYSHSNHGSHASHASHASHGSLSFES
jgi:hypothetical protein